MKLSFALYDIDGNGKVEENELVDIVNDCFEIINSKNLINNMNNVFTENLIKTTFKQINKHKKNKKNEITFEMYEKFVNKNPRILEPFNLDIENLIRNEAIKRRYSSKHMDLNTRVIHHGPLHDSKNKIVTTKREFLFKKTLSTVVSIHDVNEMCLDEKDFEKFHKISCGDDNKNSYKELE